MKRGARTQYRTDFKEPPFMNRIRLRAKRRTLWIRSLGQGELILTDPGAAILDSEIDRILTRSRRGANSESSLYAKEPSARELTKAIEIADEEARDEESWHRMASEFALSQQELDLLSLGLAVEIDPLLRRAYGYLNDDATACHPTPWLAACLFQWPALTRFSPKSGIVRLSLARPVEGLPNPWSIVTPWSADPQVAAWISDRNEIDCCVTPAPAPPANCLYHIEFAAMGALVRAMLRGSNNVRLEINLIGSAGSGRRTLATQLCAALGRQMLVADAGLLFPADAPLAAAVDVAVRAMRAARLAGAALYWHDADTIDARLWKVWPRDFAGELTFFGAESHLTRQAVRSVVTRSFTLAPLTQSARIAVWSQHSDLPTPDAVSDRILTPAEITGAARVAPAGPDAVEHACRQTLHRAPSELLTPLVCPYGWDDIVLASGVRRHLEELEEQARLRWQVYEEWGFDKLCPLGKGITAMFAGPSGTGKTMAAQVLAGSLGMDLYRIDLAGVVNKYIGETEKRLKQVFEACERANVVLFFDEADALFGQRTQVKDAHDRYANIQIDYLLQRMEQFDGIAILATNRKGDIDSAFLRRIRFVIDFLPPGPHERLALWRHSLLPNSPGGQPLLDAIDWEFLAGKLTMTGADIKSSALGAAFLARAAGTRIGMQQILHAARREMNKHGVLIRPGDWAEANNG
jgi:hypothetical protein